mmetsp:Transcript_23532/g.75029  ORF Transcript_23532/g.75029 Transcript_23532/m.75029 type:complete len:384 (+) Transcript_23532:109-1260(+)
MALGGCECQGAELAFLAVVPALVITLASSIAYVIILRKKCDLELRLQRAHKRFSPSVNAGTIGAFQPDGNDPNQREPQPWEVAFSELKLQTLIAHGGNGEVYKGTWLGTTVAIKVPRSDLNKDMYQSFVDEAVMMSRLHHPNIVMFLAACLEVGRLALVLEYLPCGTLHDRLRDEADIPLRLVLRFAVDISRGMKYLHTRCSILQRDLKPRNLLLDNRNNVKICDFGLSRQMKNNNKHFTACGTPYWSAPEVIRNEKYGPKADVFSFAIILYELTTREELYDGQPGLEVAIKVAHEGLRPRIPESCHQAFARLIRLCWAPHPDERPDFAQILEHLTQIKKTELLSQSLLLPPSRVEATDGESTMELKAGTLLRSAKPASRCKF